MGLNGTEQRLLSLHADAEALKSVKQGAEV